MLGFVAPGHARELQMSNEILVLAEPSCEVPLGDLQVIEVELELEIVDACGRDDACTGVAGGVEVSGGVLIVERFE